MGGVLTMSQRELDRIKLLERLDRQEMSQLEASTIMNLSTRQVRRLQRLYAIGGAAAVCSKKRGKSSNRRIEDSIREKISELILKKYREFGPTLAHEKLVELDNYKISLSTVRSIMTNYHIWHPKLVKEAIVHQSRERRSCLGQLIQFDGSTHDWFNGRGEKCTLLVFIDDATSKLMLLKFVPVENLADYFRAMQDYIETYGRPEAVYCDRHSSLRNRKPNLLETKGMTQFQRAMKSLNIELIHAHSPQAKGRVERANRTLQDRLVKEMSLKGISSMETANAFLEGFRADYNKRFAKAPKSQIDAHRNIDKRMNLGEIFSWHEERTVTKNLMVQYATKQYAIIPENRMRATLRGAKITVVESLEGEIKLLHAGKELAFRAYAEMPYAESGHELALKESAAGRWLSREASKPRRHHRWCNGFKLRRACKR